MKIKLGDVCVSVEQKTVWVNDEHIGKLIALEISSGINRDPANIAESFIDFSHVSVGLKDQSLENTKRVANIFAENKIYGVLESKLGNTSIFKKNGKFTVDLNRAS